MSLLRQGSHYMAIGLLQYVVDWGVMVTLSHFGTPVELANVAGRVSGAVLGFWLNGRITFARQAGRLGPQQLRRFVLLWLAMTALSTWAVAGVAGFAGLRWAWAAKPAVELLLACISFTVSRHWVYRR